MLLRRLLRFLLGSVTFTVLGGMPERFLSLAGREGVNLWDIRRRGEGLRVSVRAKAFRRLRGPVRASRVHVHIVKKSGLPFVTYRYRKRWGLAVGTALFLLVLWFLSGFVWTVSVSGNKTVGEKKIILALEDCGLSPGCWRPALNIKALENRVLLKVPELAWIAVNIRGSHANVLVRERVYPPEIEDQSIACNVKALRAGRILSIEAYEGKAMVKPGDAVVKGDLLVSGVLEEQTGVTRLVHARAKVMARTKRDLQVTVPLKQKVHVKTKHSREMYSLYAGGAVLPLYFGGAPKGPYVHYAESKPLCVLGICFPVGVRKSVYTRYRVETVTLSPQQAEQLGRKKLARLQGRELAGIKILSQNFSVKAAGAGVTVKGAYLCEENIVYQDVIKIT